MNKRDVETLLYFITRSEMYVFKDEKEYIIAFVHGYLAGSVKCSFLVELSDLLENEFKCERRALGWGGQITEYGKKNDLTWEASFKKIGLKVLSRHFHDASKNKYEKFIKLIIQSKISQIEPIYYSIQDYTLNRFGKKWIQKWYGLVDLDAEWFREIWSKKELKLISKINKQIQRIEDKDQVEIIAKKKLLDLVIKFSKTGKPDKKSHKL